MAELMPVVAIVVGCGTGIIIYALNLMFGSKGQQAQSEMRQMRELFSSQAQMIQQMQERLENLEAIVTSGEFQASQRVAKALEERQPLPQVDLPQARPQTVTRSQ